MAKSFYSAKLSARAHNGEEEERRRRRHGKTALPVRLFKIITEDVAHFRFPVSCDAEVFGLFTAGSTHSRSILKPHKVEMKKTQVLSGGEGAVSVSGTNRDLFWWLGVSHTFVIILYIDR